MPSEVRWREDELDKSSNIIMKGSSQPAGGSNTEAEAKEPTISEDPGDLALMRDVQLLLTQLKSYHPPKTELVDVVGGQKVGIRFLPTCLFLLSPSKLHFRFF